MDTAYGPQHTTYTVRHKAHSIQRNTCGATGVIVRLQDETAAHHIPNNLRDPACARDHGSRRKQPFPPSADRSNRIEERSGRMEVAGDSARICRKKTVPLQEGLINDVRLEDCEACTSQEHLNVCCLQLTLVQS